MAGRTGAVLAAWTCVTGVVAAVLAGCASSGPGGTGSATEGVRAVVPSTSSAPATSVPRTTAPAHIANPCAANASGRLVRVRIRVQHLWMCQGRVVVRSTPVTTGIPGVYTHTPKGTYRVQSRTRDTSLTLLSGQTYAVRYWIPFDGPLFGFHDSSWQRFPYGSAKYRTHGSHGCVHMPLASIRFLYRWADVGTTVRITG